MAMLALLGTLLAGTPAAAAGEPEAVTPWASSGHSAARLLAAGPAAPTALAGLEIRLDPGFITYWRNPGEAGLPPAIDTAGSENVATVTVDFPAPRQLDEGGTVAYGYTDDVLLPLRVTAADPARPAVLAVALDYAVCEKLCLPASARLRLALPAAPVPVVADRLGASLATVPRPAMLGGPGPLAILRVLPAGSPAAPVIEVSARAGPGSALFAEAAEGWFLQPDTGTPAPAGNGMTFRVAVLQRPDGATLTGLGLRLTLVDGAAAIDVPVRMDAAAGKP